MFVKNITETTQKIRIDWVETEIGAWGVFQTTESKAEELVRNYPSIIGYADAEDISWSGDLSELDDVEITNPKAWEVLTCDENWKWVNQDNKDRIQLEIWNTTAKDYQYDPTRATFEGRIYLKAWVTITAKIWYKIGAYDCIDYILQPLWNGRVTSATTTRTWFHMIAIKKDDNAKFTIEELEAIPTTYIEVSDWDYSWFKKERKIPSKWTWKRVVFIGDSITAWSGTDEWYRYYDHLNHYMKFWSMTIEGVGWSCFSNTSDYGNQNSPIAERPISTASKQADLIVVFAWTNDYGHDTPIENNDFISSATDTWFIGAVRTFVGKMIYENPTAKIVFMTPLHRKNYKNDKTKVDYVVNGAGHNLTDYVNAIKKVAQEYSCPVIDSNEIGGFLPRIARNWDLYSTDYLHPNNSWHIMLARNIKGYFELI